MKNLNTIKKSFSNDFQIRHQLNVLQANGVDIKFKMEVINNNLVIELKSIQIQKSFLESKGILNFPSIEFLEFKVKNIDLFELEKPNKTLLAQSAMKGGFSPLVSNFDKIVDHIYKQSVQDIENKQELFREKLKTVLNQNLIFLEEAIADFISFYKDRI